MPSKTRISVSELGTLIGTPFAPIIIDVCIDDDFNADPRLLPGSFRHPFRKIEDLIPQLRGKKVVVVCQKGLKLSQGAVGLLRGAGVDARYLRREILHGGMPEKFWCPMPDSVSARRRYAVGYA